MLKNKQQSIVFLDMDGVMVTHQSMLNGSNLEKSAKKSAIENWYKAIIDVGCVKRLDTLCRIANASIVISSSWRKSHTAWPAMIDWLHEAGLLAEIIDRTPDMCLAPQEDGWILWVPGERGGEIASWRLVNEHTGLYVIFDDDNDAGVGHDKQFVQCDFDFGLSESCSEKALEMFGAKNE